MLCPAARSVVRRRRGGEVAGTSSCPGMWPTVMVSGSKAEEVAIEPDEVAHRSSARRPSGSAAVIDPHRELQVGRAALVEQQEVSTISQPYQISPPQNTSATTQLNTSSQRCPRGRHERAAPGRAAHGRRCAPAGCETIMIAPDDEIDDHLFGPGDRVARDEIAADDLHQPDHAWQRAEQADRNRSTVSQSGSRARKLSRAGSGALLPTVSVTSLTISGESLASLGSGPLVASIIRLRSAANCCGGWIDERDAVRLHASCGRAACDFADIRAVALDIGGPDVAHQLLRSASVSFDQKASLTIGMYWPTELMIRVGVLHAGFPQLGRRAALVRARQSRRTCPATARAGRSARAWCWEWRARRRCARKCRRRRGCGSSGR